MSKRQKGRRHRRVNRTPRPVGAARPRAMAAASQPAVAPMASQPAGPAAPAVAAAARRRPLERETRPAAPAADLGRHAARTWESLRTCGAAGASLEELCAAAGYQPRTVTKHVQSLADQGLAELRDERWYAREALAAS
ncbi:hypothetical protein AB0C81_15405 [Streptomyces roseoverticillatus]|uniref:hypothetical protein n=1 Tax=Streptomyces roseoverticillatus TaxID=66429 RepID=UPI0033F4F80E